MISSLPLLKYLVDCYGHNLASGYTGVKRRAESHFQAAVRLAESGDINSAQRNAANALRVYREATSQAIERGSIGDLEIRIKYSEGMIGDRIHGTGLKWGHLQGSEWVEATYASDNTLNVDLDLEAEVPGPNPEADIDFDLIFTATLIVETANFDPGVIYSLFDDIETLGIVEFFADDIEDRIKDSFRPITESFVIPAGGLCPTVKVDEHGWIIFII